MAVIVTTKQLGLRYRMKLQVECLLLDVHCPDRRRIVSALSDIYASLRSQRSGK